jgi:hypothetical protein
VNGSRKQDAWDRWHSSSWYLRASILAVVFFVIVIGALELLLDGGALFGFVRDNKYFLAHQGGSEPVQVSALQYWASVAALWGLYASVTFLCLSLVLRAWGNSRTPNTSLERTREG